MATAVSQLHVRHLGFFKNYIFKRKAAANFLEISRKHGLLPQMGIKLKIEWKKSEQILSKRYSFLFQAVIYRIDFAHIMSDDVIQLTSKDAFIIGLQVLNGLF